MSSAGWADIWSLLLAHISVQAIEVRILIGLGAAFTTLMIIEGLRASFLPRRQVHAVATPSARPAAPVRTEKRSASAPFRPRPAAIVVPKRAKPAANPHRPERPKIKRLR